MANNNEEMEVDMGTGPRGVPIRVIKRFGNDKTAADAAADGLNAILFGHVEGENVPDYLKDATALLQAINHFQTDYDYILDASDDRANAKLVSSMLTVVVRQYVEKLLPPQLLQAKNAIEASEAQKNAAMDFKNAAMDSKDAAIASLTNEKELANAETKNAIADKEAVVAENLALKEELKSTQEKLTVALEKLKSFAENQENQEDQHRPQRLSDGFDQEEARILNGDDNDVLYGGHTAQPQHVLLDQNNERTLAHLTDTESVQVELLEEKLTDLAGAMTGVILWTAKNATVKTPKKTQSNSS